MIVQAKGGSKRIHLSEEEITLDELKRCANMLHAPNINVFDRVGTVVSFPHNKTFPEGATAEELRGFMNEWKAARDEETKIYEVLAEEVNRQMEQALKIGLVTGSRELPSGARELKGLNLDPVNFSEVFVEGIGRLIIER